MYLVLGSALDDVPYRLVQRWQEVGRDVALATPADLSLSGWRLRIGSAPEARAAVGQRLVSATELDAVISLLPWISHAELRHVVAEDRDYVVHEMSAFLLAWLHQVPCRVIDPPSTLSLAGCGRSSHEWAALASAIGVAADATWSGAFSTVTVVGGRVVGLVASPVAAAAEAITAAAGRALVTLRFAEEHVIGDAEPVFAGTQVRPEVGSVNAADALLAWLEAA